MSIRGREIKLNNGNYVFLGRRSDYEDDCNYVRFVNTDGDETKLKLSDEALEALRLLKSNSATAIRRSYELEVPTKPEQCQWQVVVSPPAGLTDG